MLTAAASCEGMVGICCRKAASNVPQRMRALKKRRRVKDPVPPETDQTTRWWCVRYATTTANLGVCLHRHRSNAKGREKPTQSPFDEDQAHGSVPPWNFGPYS